ISFQTVWFPPKLTLDTQHWDEVWLWIAPVGVAPTWLRERGETDKPILCCTVQPHLATAGPVEIVQHAARLALDPIAHLQFPWFGTTVEILHCGQVNIGWLEGALGEQNGHHPPYRNHGLPSQKVGG